LPHCQGTLPGTVSTGATFHLSRRDWDMASPDTPCLAVLEHIVQAGWSVGKGPTADTPASPRVFTWRADMSQKPYWQCLATLDSIFPKGLLQLRSGLPHKYYTAVLCAADAQALALVEGDFEAKVGAPKRLGDCQNVNARQHEVLGGDGPMRTAWRRDLTHGEARAITSVKRPWDCVSHESAVTLDTQSCVIPLVPQAALLRQVNSSRGRTHSTCPQTRLVRATRMVLCLHSQSLAWFLSLKDSLRALRNAVASARRVTTDVFLLHVRFIARQVQHRVVFGETQDLPRLPRLAARSHSRTLGLG